MCLNTWPQPLELFWELVRASGCGVSLLEAGRKGRGMEAAGGLCFQLHLSTPQLGIMQQAAITCPLSCLLPRDGLWA